MFLALIKCQERSILCESVEYYKNMSNIDALRAFLFTASSLFGAVVFLLFAAAFVLGWRHVGFYTCYRM